MGGEVLDQIGGRLDDVGVEPEDPRGGWAEGGEEQRVAGFGHGGAADLLVLDLVPFGFVLGLERGVKVLSEDDDAFEPVFFRARLLCFGDLLLEFGCGGVALLCLGEDEAQGD